MYSETEERKQKIKEIAENKFTWTPADFYNYLEIVVE